MLVMFILFVSVVSLVVDVIMFDFVLQVGSIVDVWVVSVMVDNFVCIVIVNFLMDVMLEVVLMLG